MFDLSNFLSPKELVAMKQEVVEETLSYAYPIVAMEYKDGILMFAENPSISLHKTSELYDRIAFAGTGVFNDYERLRKAGVHMADVKGFQYSREDVKAKFIASEYSTALGDIFVRQQVPMEVEILVVEIGMDPLDNRMYFIPFSGGLKEVRGFVVIGDYVKDESDIKKGLINRFLIEKNPAPDIELKDAVVICRDAIATVRNHSQLSTGTSELVTLDRTIASERKFTRFPHERIAELLG